MRSHSVVALAVHGLGAVDLVDSAVDAAAEEAGARHMRR